MSEEAIQPPILVVDDDPLVLDMLETALEEGGFQVKSAMSSAEALAALQANASELSALVTDINLGSPLSGWDVAKQARELNGSLPVVYVSGDSAHEWSVHGVPKSVLVQKPFAAAQIVTAVAGLINDQSPLA
jgi:CheY-like chemotaxis protein